MTNKARHQFLDQRPGVRRSVLCCAIVLIAAFYGSAQQNAGLTATSGYTPSAVAPGTPAGSYILSGFDTVNLSNLHVNFLFPLLRIGGNGRGSASVTVTPNMNRQWQAAVTPVPKSNTCGANGCQFDYFYTVNNTDWQPLPFIPGVPRLVARQVGNTCQTLLPSSNVWAVTLTRLTATSADGTETEFVDQQTGGLAKPGVASTSTSGGYPRGVTFLARDGSSAIVTTSSVVTDIKGCATGNVPISGTMVTRDGVTYTFVNGYASQISDRNGNTISYPSVNSGATIKDPEGRSYQISAAAGELNSISWTGTTGSPRSINVKYDVLGNLFLTGGKQTYSTQTTGELWPALVQCASVSCPAATTGQTINPSLISEIDLPDGSAYKFLYNSYGDVAQVTLPTGGAVQYDYQVYYGDHTLPNPTMITTQITERREYANGASNAPTAITDYFGCTSASGSCIQVDHFDGAKNLVSMDQHVFGSLVTSTLSDPTQYNSWLDGKEIETDYYAKDGTALLRRVATPYQQRSCAGDTTCWFLAAPYSYQLTDYRSPAHDPQVMSETTTEGSVVRQTSYSAYDLYNNVVDMTESDWGSGSPVGVLRETKTTYNTGSSYTLANILNLPTEKKILNGSGALVADTQYGYDATALNPSYSSVSGYTAPTAPRGNRTSVSYCVNLAACSSAASLLTNSYAYDNVGNVTSIQDANGSVYKLGYGDNYTNGTTGTYAHVTSLTNPKIQARTWQYDFNTGQATSAADLNLVAANYTYNDKLDRVTMIARATKTAVESDTNVSYSVGTTQVDVTSDQVVTGQPVLHTQTLYDGFGRETSEKTYEPSAKTTIITATKSYDALGRLSQTTSPSRGNDGLGYATTYNYDGLGRTLSVITADGAVATTSYSGNQTTVTDQTASSGNAGKQRTMVADGLGRLTSVLEDPTGLAYLTLYGYDALDDLISVNQSGLQRSFAYDGLKRLVAASNPENASAAVPGRLTCAGSTVSNWTSCYSYDSVGNLLSKMDNRKTTTSYTYDSLNRVMSKSYTLGTGVAATPSVAYCYDAVYTTTCPAAGVTGFIGRLTAVVSSSSSTYYNGFDAMGRVLSQSQVTAGNTYGFGYTYNLAGAMTSEQYPSGRLVNTCYDGVNRVVQVGLSACGSATATATVYAGSVTYAPHGAPWLWVMGNGVDHSPNYNSRLQVCGIQDVLGGGSFSPQPCGTLAVTGGTSLLNVKLIWGTTNNNGDLLGSTFTHSGPGFTSPLAFTQGYTYDGVNRLASVTDTGYTRSFGYDAFGNMYVKGTPTGVIPPANTPQSAGMYSKNQLPTSGGIYSYDAAGNETFVNGNTVAYDAENRQTGVSGLSVNETYVYDGDGRRVGKVSNTSGTPTTVFVYDAMGRMAAEYSSVVDTPSCVTCYLSGDQLGTARMVTDQNGSVVARHDYLPFGEEVLSGVAGRVASGNWGVSGDSISQKFTGKERDSESGLDYFGARYYGSALGRWVSPDVVNLTEARLLSPSTTLNKYVYAADNPLKFIDPDGRDITYFYDSGGPAGHAVLFAYNQSTGDSAIESFGPASKSPLFRAAEVTLSQVPAKSMFDMDTVNSADDLRQQYSSLTISTTPELTQQVIDYMRAHPDPATWGVLGPSCSSEVWLILRRFKLLGPWDVTNPYPGLTPKLLWDQLTYTYNRAYWGEKPTAGSEYGKYQFSSNSGLSFDLMWQSLQKSSEQVTSKICYQDGGCQ